MWLHVLQFSFISHYHNFCLTIVTLFLINATLHLATFFPRNCDILFILFNNTIIFFIVYSEAKKGFIDIHPLTQSNFYVYFKISL